MKVLLLQIGTMLVATLKVAAQSSVPAAAVDIRLIHPDTLLGKWVQCVTKWHKRARHFLGKSTEMDYELTGNICSEFIFRSDHTGNYKSGGGFLQNFTWQVVNNRLVIANTPARTKSSQEAGALADGSYDVLFNPKQLRFVDLSLTNSQGTRYILTKMH